MSSRERERRRPRRRALRILGAVLYWLAVLAISLALVVGLILLLESRDESEISGALPLGVRLTGSGAEALGSVRTWTQEGPAKRLAVLPADVGDTADRRPVSQ